MCLNQCDEFFKGGRYRSCAQGIPTRIDGTSLTKSRTAACGSLLIERILLSRNDHPEDEVDQDTRHTTWDERNDQCQAEPERTDAEEFSKSATDASDHTITFRSAQSLFLIDRHFLLLCRYFDSIYGDRQKKSHGITHCEHIVQTTQVTASTRPERLRGCNGSLYHC